MRTNLSFSACFGFVLVILAAHIFASSDAGVGRVGATPAQVSSLGESPIGPLYRQKRYKQTLTITNKVGKDGEDEDDDNDEDSGQSEQVDDGDDSDDENEDDDSDEDEDEEKDDNDEDTNEIEEESEGHSKPLSATSAVRKNLNLLKSTRKSLRRYVREDSQLNKLMSESSELAKEVGNVFRQMAKREASLEKEMESLKEALNGAVVTLKNTIREEEQAEKLVEEKEKKAKVDGKEAPAVEAAEGDGKQTQLRSRRHFNNHQKNPYRACVEIEPISDDEFLGRKQQTSALAGSSRYGSSTNLATVKEFMPSKNTASNTQSTQTQTMSRYESANSANNGQYTVDIREKAFQQPPPPASVNYPPPMPRPLPMIPQPHPKTEVHSFEKEVEVHSTRVANANNNAPPVRSYQSSRNFDQSSESRASNQQAQYQSSMNQGGGANIQSSQFRTQQSIHGSTSNNAQFQNQQQRGSSNMNDVDLGEVYWLRLDPQRQQEQLHQKVDSLLKEKQSQGKDVLVIPMKHGLKNTDEVKNGFLRAVRVRPQALAHKLFRRLRSLRVYEL